MRIALILMGFISFNQVYSQSGSKGKYKPMPEIKFGEEKKSDKKIEKEAPVKKGTKLPNSSCVSYWKKNEASCADGGYNYTFTNNCSDPLDVFYAIERNNGDWSYGVYGSLKAGKTFSVWACRINDNVVVLSRSPGSGVKFPSDSELKKTYSTRQ